MMKKATDKDIRIYVFKNTCSCAPNDVYKCIGFKFPLLQRCYYCFSVLSAAVATILPLSGSPYLGTLVHYLRNPIRNLLNI